MYWKTLVTIVLVTSVGRVISNESDDCDYRKEDRCGDVCISREQVKNCDCGGQQFRINYDYKQCCVPPSSTTSCYVDSNGDGHCDQGEVKSQSEPCHGQCYNEYQTSQTLGHRSQFACASGDQCVAVRSMCQGYALCDDKSDLAACSPELSCVESSYYSSTKHTLNTTLARGHTFCKYSDRINDGEYDTIGRNDEDVLQATSSHDQTIDYSKLASCTADYGPGVMCGQECEDNFLWCRDPTEYATDSCDYGDFVISDSDQRLCSNATFWSDKSCDIIDSDGDTWAHGTRCSGSRQHCYYPWYNVVNPDYERNKAILPGSCADKSDEIFPSGSVCDPNIHLEKYKSHKFCDIWEENLCSDPAGWFSSKTSSEYRDPHNCQGSCLTPGVNCTACTNPEYFHCKRNNISVCLHPTLKCDGHPQCG